VDVKAVEADAVDVKAVEAEDAVDVN